VVLASRNPGKLRELAALLEPAGLELLSLSGFDAPDVEETGLTFVENALLKARSAARASGLPAIADDSGLAVDALDGAPGIRSARYAGDGASDEQNLQALLRALDGVPAAERTARFICALVYLRHPADPCPLVCEGRWEGRVLEAPRGEHGFGYDPVFHVPALGAAAAELEPEVKNRRSHRGQALADLRRRLGLA
jgi:XTP/dITP diphosphohydrolase